MVITCQGVCLAYKLGNKIDPMFSVMKSTEQDKQHVCCCYRGLVYIWRSNLQEPMTFTLTARGAFHLETLYLTDFPLQQLYLRDCSWAVLCMEKVSTVSEAPVV